MTKQQKAICRLIRRRMNKAGFTWHEDNESLEQISKLSSFAFLQFAVAFRDFMRCLGMAILRKQKAI